jgi:hypothetical protein
MSFKVVLYVDIIFFLLQQSFPVSPCTSIITYFMFLCSDTCDGALGRRLEGPYAQGYYLASLRCRSGRYSIESLLLVLHVSRLWILIVKNLIQLHIFVNYALGSSTEFGSPEMTGRLNHCTEQLQWAVNYDGRPEMLQGLKEIGSLIFWMSLLDTAMVVENSPLTKILY